MDYGFLFCRTYLLHRYHLLFDRDENTHPSVGQQSAEKVKGHAVMSCKLFFGPNLVPARLALANLLCGAGTFRGGWLAVCERETDGSGSGGD